MKRRLKRWGSLLLTMAMLLGNGIVSAQAAGEQSTGTVQPNTTATDQTSGMLIKHNRISVGVYHSIALDNDGNVLVWGYNNKAQLGYENLNTDKTFAKFTGLDAVAVGATEGTSYVLKKDGTVWYWGEPYNRSGRYTTKPTLVPYLGSDVVDLSCGQSYCLALKSDGSVWEWGEVLNGNGFSPRGPHKVLQTAKMICAGAYTRFAVLQDGTVWGWGMNNYQPKVLSSNSDWVDKPVKLNGIEDAVEVACGYNFVLARKNDGTIWSWGDNSKGQLGNGTTNSSGVPVQISGLSGVTALLAGFDHALAITGDGQLWEWGSYTYKSVGDQSNIVRTTPLRIGGLSVSQIATAPASDHSLALTKDGSIWGWGYDINSKILGLQQYLSHPVLIFGAGEGGSAYDVDPDTEIPPIKQLYTGENHTLALCEDGTLWAWGNNAEGQLGVGSNGDKSKPTQITGIGKVKSVEAGHNHTLIICEDGSVWAWGKNDHGQLGIGNTQNQFKPVRLR